MKLSTLCIIYSIAMSLGNWFCMSRKGGTGEVGCYTQIVKQHGHVWAGCLSRAILLF